MAHIFSHIKTVSKSFGLPLNVQKNKMMVIEEEKESQISTDVIPLENVQSFIYLGVHIHINGEFDQE